MRSIIVGVILVSALLTAAAATVAAGAGARAPIDVADTFEQHVLSFLAASKKGGTLPQLNVDHEVLRNIQRIKHAVLESQRHLSAEQHHDLLKRHLSYSSSFSSSTPSSSPRQGAVAALSSSLGEWPPCIDGPGVCNSGDLVTMYYGAHSLGQPWECENLLQSTHEWCRLELQLMCVKVNLSSAEHPIVLKKYDKELACNGVHGALGNGVCRNVVNGTCGNQTEFDESLFWWSLGLQNFVATRLTIYPVCYAVEAYLRFPTAKAEDDDSERRSFFDDCGMNTSFFYVQSVCDFKEQSVVRDDSDGKRAVQGVMLTLLGLSAIGTLLGLARWGWKLVAEVIRERRDDRNHNNDHNNKNMHVSASDAEGTTAPTSAGDTAASSSAVSPLQSGLLVLNRASIVGGGASSRTSAVSMLMRDDVDGETAMMKQQQQQQQGAVEQEEKERKCGVVSDFFGAFDVVAGLKELMAQEEERPTNFFNGLRVIAITGILVGHMTYFPRASGFFLFDLTAFFESYLSIVVLPFALAVDVFFFLSAYLAYSLLMQQVKRVVMPDEKQQQPRPLANAIPILLAAYGFRYVRLVVPVLLVISVVIFIVTTSGPLSHIWTHAAELKGCKDTLWATALLIQNTDEDRFTCLSWVWYLCADVQMFLCVPPLVALHVVFVRHGPTKFIAAETAEWMVVAAITLAVFILSVYHHPITTEFVDSAANSKKYYFSAAERAPPYCFGLLTAILVHNKHVRAYLQHKSRRRTTSLCLNLVAGCFFVLTWNLVWEGVSGLASTGKISDAANFKFHFFYMLFGGTVLLPLTLDAVVVAAVAVAGGAKTEKTWFVRMLEHHVFAILARCSFGVYLTHAVICLFVISKMSSYVFVFHAGFYFTLAFGVLVLSNVAGALLFTLVEHPLGVLLNFIGRVTGAKKRKKRKPTTIITELKQSQTSLSI